jgi:hypothetical protein
LKRDVTLKPSSAQWVLVAVARIEHKRLLFQRSEYAAQQF